MYDDDDDDDEKRPQELAVAGSAITGEGLLDLLKALDEALRYVGR